MAAKVEQLKRRVDQAAAALGETTLRVVFQLCAVGGDLGYCNIEGEEVEPTPSDCVLTIRADMLPILTADKDFLVLHGGRDGAKSGTVARWLIGRMVMGRERVLAIRESRFAITRSLQRLILDIIEADPKLSEFFPLDLRQTEKIQARNGSEIFFLGLRDYRASTVRSYQGVTLCWVEEAQDLSRMSLDVLIPTIREAGSQILFTLNPHRESDPVYRDFISRDDPDAAVGQFLYAGNPWLSEKTLRRVDFLRTKDPEQFSHVYGGSVRSYSESRIYERVTVCDFDIQTVIDRRLQTEIKSDPMLPIATRRQRTEAPARGDPIGVLFRVGFRASAEHPACLLEIYLDDGPAKSIYITGEAYKVATDPAVLLAMCSRFSSSGRAIQSAATTRGRI